MNSYPEWWNHTITVFNKYEDPTTRQITWYKTTINKCFWKYTDTKLSVGETVIETASTLCRVPINKLFKERFEWESLSNADKAKYFTFGIGDIIVLGTVTDTVNEYTAGTRSSDLINKYKKLQGCMVINQCSVNTGIGRGNEHYYIRGV